MPDQLELSRRIGYAKGIIREEMGCIEGHGGPQDDRNYWAYKALVRAVDELDGKTIAGKAVAS